MFQCRKMSYSSILFSSTLGTNLTLSPRFYSLFWSPDYPRRFLPTPRRPLPVWSVAARWCSASSLRKPSSWRCGPPVFPFPWLPRPRASPPPSPCPRSCAPSFPGSSPAPVRTWGESSSWSCGAGPAWGWRRRSAGTGPSVGEAEWGRSRPCGRTDPPLPCRGLPSSPPDDPGTWAAAPASPLSGLGSSWWGSAC